jgi:hypothetical protein
MCYQLTSWLTLHIQLRMSCDDLGRVGDDTNKKAGRDARRMIKVKVTDDRPSGSETRAQDAQIAAVLDQA